MKEFSPILIGAVVNGVFMAIAIWAIKSMITGFQSAIRETVESLKKAIDKLEAADDKLWDNLNCHGHRGLNGDNNQVTRYK